MAIVASQPITSKQTWLTISGTDGFTLPGMIDDPGCTAGSMISDRPARGPMLRSRRSLATLPTSTARRRIAPEDARPSPMLRVARPRAPRGRADVHFLQLLCRRSDTVAAAAHASGVAAELLPERRVGKEC